MNKGSQTVLVIHSITVYSLGMFSLGFYEKLLKYHPNQYLTLSPELAMCLATCFAPLRSRPGRLCQGTQHTASSIA